MDFKDLKEKRKAYYDLRTQAKANNDNDEYIKYNKLYYAITSKISYEKNKDNEDYKKRKMESIKRYYDKNTEKVKTYIKERNKELYQLGKEYKQVLIKINQ
jgi:hypothetical protein